MTGGTGAQARIVVGLSESPASVAALRWAIREARLTGSTVEVVHVWTGSVSPFGDLVHARAGVHAERDAAGQVLQSAIEAVRNVDPHSDVPIVSELVAGYPSVVLQAKLRGARMAVLGKSRHNNLNQFLHKPVTHAVTRHAPCRVVIVAADGLVVRDSALLSPQT